MTNKFHEQFMAIYNQHMAELEGRTSGYNRTEPADEPILLLYGDEKPEKREVKVVTDHVCFRNTPLAHAYDQAWAFKQRHRNDPNFHVIDEREETNQGLTVHITYTHSEDDIW